MKLLIKSHVYDIPKRLKEIDSGYFVVFDSERKKYEVHNRHNIDNTYCLTVPYDELDSRTIDYVKRTRAENAKRIIEDMEAHNAKLENDRNKKWSDYIETTAKDIYKYGQHKADEARFI